MFAEDFTYRQLDGVIINLGGTVIMAYGHLLRGAGEESTKCGITSSYTFGCLPDIHWTSRRICLHCGLQRYASPNWRTFLSTLTVDIASSYGDLISWHGDKLALIGLDDPVITVCFFDEIPPNSDKRWSDNRTYHGEIIRSNHSAFLFTYLASLRSDL